MFFDPTGNRSILFAIRTVFGDGLCGPVGSWPYPIPIETRAIRERFRRLKTLDRFERRSWCEDRGVRLDNSALIGSTRSVALKVPEKTHRLLDLVCELFSSEPQFPGGLFWIVDLGSRNDQVCEIALSIHSLMLETSGGTKMGAMRPQDLSFLFDKGERPKAQAFLLHAFLFGWGGYFVPGSGEYYLFINPDGVFEAFTDADQWIEFFSSFPEKLGMRQYDHWIDRKPEKP